MFFERIVILLVICELEFLRGQEYVLDPRFHLQAQNDYQIQKRPIEFQQHFPGFSSFEPFIPQRDLQTSDVPVHLQKTLPQYRFSSGEQLTKTKPTYHTNLAFRPNYEKAEQNILPSTHRPNYSHFFSKNHQVLIPGTENVLGQVTVDNTFGSVDNLYRNQESFKQGKSEGNKPIPPVILRQHTRILAPDPEDKQNELQEKKYFVNENGEVLGNPIISSKRLSTKLNIEDENTKSQDYPRYNVINNYDKTSYLSGAEDQAFNSANNFDLTDYEYDEDDMKLFTTPKSVTGGPIDSKLKVDAGRSPKKIIEHSENENKFNDSVISVVTTKSVINNTIIPTNRPPPLPVAVTQSTVENSTDSWVVVASVQTSKSISGAHYLPSSIVAQDERLALLNEKSQEDYSDENASTEDYSSYEDNEEETTTEEVTTMAPMKHSTESLIDKLDRVQSDLSSGLLTGGYKNDDNNIAVITENMTDKIHVADMTESPTEASQLFPSISKSNAPVIKKFSSRSRPPTSNLYPKLKPQTHKKSPVTPKSIDNDKTTNGEPTIKIAKTEAFVPPGYKFPSGKTSSSDLVADILKKFKESQNNEAKVTQQESAKNTSDDSTPHHRFGSSHQSTTESSINSTKNELSFSIDALLKNAKPVDIKTFLPPGYKPDKITDDSKEEKIINEDVSQVNTTHLLYSSEKTTAAPSDVKSPHTPTTKTPGDDLFKVVKQVDISAFLPPGYKEETTTKKSTKIDDLLKNSKEDDISAFLPPGFKAKPSSTSAKSKIENILEKSKKDDLSAFLPPGFKPKFTTRKPITKSIESEDLPTSLLPSGYKSRKSSDTEKEKLPSSTQASVVPSVPTVVETTTSKGSLKIVFPSRPGGNKRANHKLTTSRPKEEYREVTQVPVPTIHKGWPTRATTEFTGWPTPSTTPISIEKLLASVQKVSPTSEEPDNIISTTSTRTTVTTTTTTTQKPTTPGVCSEECDLVGTIKLVDGVKWVPELLDRNTKEWQILANEVKSQLEEVYSQSDSLRSYFKNLRIDGFSQGSVLVDYLIKMENTDMYMSTSRMKELFNEALESTFIKPTLREGKALNESVKYTKEAAKLGKFIIDPMYTDFIVVPKQSAPTIAYDEEDLLLPQWAIAVMVIGLASLLFVIIFGVTVLVNRSKNAKKKVPIPLTDDMLNELNKDHMGGYDNYGVEDPYNIEAGFWDPRRIEAHKEYHKFPKKGSTGSMHDNSMTNLYDSWNSQNNGYHNNSAGSYYGQHGGPGSSHKLYERRRSYDTNF